jgi:hypothetical protein
LAEPGFDRGERLAGGIGSPGLAHTDRSTEDSEPSNSGWPTGVGAGGSIDRPAIAHLCLRGVGSVAACGLAGG